MKNKKIHVNKMLYYEISTWGKGQQADVVKNMTTTQMLWGSIHPLSTLEQIT